MAALFVVVVLKRPVYLIHPHISCVMSQLIEPFFKELKAMSTICWIVFCAVVKNTPARCERKWPKTAAIFPPESNPRSSLLTSFSVRFSVHSTQESVPKTYPICDDSLSRPKQRSIAAGQKSIRNRGFVCERKPCPICFWCRHNSCPVQCRTK